MTDLAAWLLDQIGADEQSARAAHGDPTFDGTGIVNGDLRHPAQVLLSHTAQHIARWDPARVLAECDAKRRIVAAHPIERGLTPYEQSWGTGLDYGCEICHEHDGIVRGAGYCDTLKALALPYADRPGFLEEWRVPLPD